MKFTNNLKYILLPIFIFVIAACGNGETADESGGASDDTVKGTINVSAAASLVDALEEVSERFNEGDPGVQVEVSVGGSGALRQQSRQGAPGDGWFCSDV